MSVGTAHAQSPASRRRETIETTSGSLSPNLRRLFERMRRLGYGTIHGLHVLAGDPLFNPPPLVVRTVRLSDHVSTSQGTANADYTLKREQIALLRELTAIEAGVIEVIKVHDGLPVGLEMHEQP